MDINELCCIYPLVRDGANRMTLPSVAALSYLDGENPLHRRHHLRARGKVRARVTVKVSTRVRVSVGGDGTVRVGGEVNDITNPDTQIHTEKERTDVGITVLTVTVIESTVGVH